MKIIERLHVDWFLFAPAFLASLAGLVTMNSFSGENYFFLRQSIWLLVVVIIFFVATTIDWRFLRQTRVLVAIFFVTLFVLGLLSVIGYTAKGAERWLRFGPIAFQPFDLARIAIVLMLAKYFSRRHVEIRNIRHILVSGFYTLLIFVPLFLQPNFSGAVVVASIWLGMVLISGISKKHLLAVAVMGTLAFVVLWAFLLAPYQKTIAVGSGQIFGKGIGQGSQSKLQYLPEYETDFIFAAFTEEWGFIGALILLALFLMLILRITENAQLAATNFESFFGLGVVIWFFVHIVVNTGMNIGVLPVTGITFPFMSYGGVALIIKTVFSG